MLWSCDESRKVILFALDIKNDMAHPFLVEGVNKKNGDLSLKSLETVNLKSPALNNAICVTYQDYNYGNYLFKRWYATQN